MAKIQIRVTQQHITRAQFLVGNGWEGLRKRCPIALALREDYKNATVGGDTFSLNSVSLNLQGQYNSTKRMIHFIELFDSGQYSKVKPTVFTVTI